MKGHTKIELTNVKTGEVTVHEEDNIVTNWLHDAHQIQVPWACDSFKHTKDITITGYSTTLTDAWRDPYYDFGGLILFKEQLDEDPDNYYPRGTVTMVGHGSDDTYSGKDLTRGSFNDNLSSYHVANKTATLVWDFNLEQGNGEIGTVCLCNHADGKIGYGSKYYPEASNEAKAPFYHHAGMGGLAYNLYFNYYTNTSRDYGNAPGFSTVYISKAENKVICLLTGLSYNSIVAAVTDVDSESVQVFDYTYRNSNTVSQTINSARTQFYEFPISSVTTTGTRTQFAPFNRVVTWSGLDHQGNFWFADKAHIFFSNSTKSGKLTWTNGSAMTFKKLNLKTMELTEYSVTNTTGANITAQSGSTSTGYFSQLCVYNDYLYIRGDNAQLYAINLNNNADVHIVMRDDETDTAIKVYKSTDEDSTSMSYNAVRMGWAVDVLGDKIIFNTSGGFNTTTEGYMYMLDTNSFTCKPLCAPQKPYCSPNPSTGSSTNVPNNRNTGSSLLLCHTDGIVRFVSSNSTTVNWETEYSKRYLANTCTVCNYGYPPLALITINRLSEPVTKTADMTMRITYTITA